MSDVSDGKVAVFVILAVASFVVGVAGLAMRQPVASALVVVVWVVALFFDPESWRARK